MDCSPPGYSVHGILQARILEWAAISFSGDLPDPGIEPMSPASPSLAGRFFTIEPAGKPFNTLETNNLQLCSNCSLCYREYTPSSKLCVLYSECQLKQFSCHSHVWGWKIIHVTLLEQRESCTVLLWTVDWKFHIEPLSQSKLWNCKVIHVFFLSQSM